MYINLFKFGGTSVNSAAGIKNVADIVNKFSSRPLLVVVSAMGKTTNALEDVLKNYMNNDPVAVVDSFQKVWNYHFAILDELFADKDHVVFGEIGSLFDNLRGYIRKGSLYTANRPDFDFEYDQIVSFGELISSAILNHYLILQNHCQDVKI